MVSLVLVRAQPFFLSYCVLLRRTPSCIGKTVFLWYLLDRLLREKQVVSLHMPYNPPLLFFHDKMYEWLHAPLGVFAYHNLSIPSVQNTSIWSLFDVAMDPPPLALNPQCFVVQAPSPHPNRMRWTKKHMLIFETALPSCGHVKSSVLRK